MNTQRIMVKEIGTALAVLAIYLLTILAPLHQARASQLAFAELGYASLETGWVLCAPLEAPSDNNDVAPTKCPAAGIGKHEIVVPNSVLLPLDSTALAASGLPLPQPAPSSSAPGALGARAPPVLG